MSATSKYKRIVIVDPQLKDCKGHNYRYSMGIAKELSVPTVVLSHVQFSGDSGQELDIRPSLSFDQYNNNAFKEGYTPSFIERLGRYRETILDILTKRNGIWESDSPVGIVVAFLAKVIAVLLFIPALIMQVKTLIVGRGSSAHTDTTALELKKAFKSVKLSRGDLLVFQTMMWPTFESLLEYRIQSREKFDCDAVFIVHEDWLIYNTAFVKFTPEKLQKRVLESLPFNRAKILSTNKPLSDYCEEWSGYRPDVVKEIEFPVGELPSPVGDSNGKKRILIPGVYRGDKNFESVGLLVEKIVGAHQGLEFCIHESVLARVALPSQYGDLFTVYSDIQGAVQWLQFLSTFDVILLPYGDIYRHRISGIIHEARLINIPVVCNKDIADSALLADERLLYGDKGEAIDLAMTAAFEVINSEKIFSELFPSDFTDLLSKESGWVDTVDKPIAVQVKPAWTRCGTSSVLDAQMEYLVDRGYFVIEIYLKTEPWQCSVQQIDFMWDVMKGGRQYAGGMVVRVLLKDIKLFPLLGYVHSLFTKRIPAFFKRENIHSTWCRPDDALIKFFDEKTVDIVLVNHIFNNDFSYKFIKAKKYICETHDIQINQLLLRRPELQGNYDNELNYELELLENYSAVVNLNKNEHALIESRLGEKAKYIRPPILKRKIAKEYETLEDLLSAQTRYKEIDTLPERFDLLIIGDGHPANINSTQEFIDKAFKLLPAGTTLGVIGRLAKHLDVDMTDGLGNPISDNIFLVGFMDDLCNIYEFSTLLVLPDVMGEGIPIKTDNAIASNVPFVATKHAMRGFDADELKELNIHPAENIEEIISSIIPLLNSEVERGAVKAQYEQLIKIKNSEEYYLSWDNVISS